MAIEDGTHARVLTPSLAHSFFVSYFSHVTSVVSCFTQVTVVVSYFTHVTAVVSDFAHVTAVLSYFAHVVVVVVVVVGQTVGSISSKTLAYDCLYTLELCTASMIATS